MSVLRLEGLRKSFVTAAGTATVLDGVDLTVEPGEVVAIAGRSGSGKTVLLTVVAGWERPDAGTVVLRPGNGTEDPGSDGAGPRWRDLAVVPQSLGLLDELTVDENITLPRRLDAGRRRDPAGPDDVPDLAARLGLDHLADRFPDQISRGEQQRVAIARAAALAPALLIADEPIAHQNEAWATAVMELVADLATRGTACLLATHNPLALDGADRVLDLADGRLHERTP
jgi:ABC-type lipoprotein export system ATPase subunit